MLEGSDDILAHDMSVLTEVLDRMEVPPIDTPKKSEEAKSKNAPDGSSHRRVDKSPQGSAGEGPPKPSSKSK